MIFGFSLDAIPLQVALITYFGRVCEELRELKLLESDKVCCC